MLRHPTMAKPDMPWSVNLYRDFVARHAERFRQNLGANLVLAALGMRDRAHMADIRLQAQRTRKKTVRQEPFLRVHC